MAPGLLGAVLRHDTADGVVAVRLTEVEAYGAEDDPGSHACRGRTARNASMFASPGTLYCYLIYGMHICANVSAGDGPGAVLLRAGEVIEGIELARSRRASPGGRLRKDRDLARGPANLCRALAIGLEHDGRQLERGTPSLTVTGDADGAGPARVSAGPRVGLRLAADRPWRWWLTGDPTVSQYRPAAPRRRGEI